MTTDPTKIQFVDFCGLVLRGEGDPNQLPEAIQLARENLTKLKANFTAELSQNTPTAKSSLQGDINEILHSFEAYGLSINAIEKYLHDKQATTLSSGIEMVRRALERLQSAFYRYRASSLAVLGPTDMPNYNLFFKTIQDYQENKIEEEALYGLIHTALFTVNQEIQKFQKYNAIQEVKQLLETYQTHQSLLSSLEQDIKKQTKSFRIFLETFQKCSETMIRQKIPARFKILTQEGGSSNAASFMLNLCNGIVSSRIDTLYFNKALEQLINEYNSLLERFKHTDKKSYNSALFEEAMRENESGLVYYEQAILAFKQFQEKAEISCINQGSRLLNQAFLLLSSAAQKTSHVNENEGKVICVKCSFYNRSDRKLCEKCGAVLIRKIEESSEEQEIREALRNMPMTENIKVILDSAEGISQSLLTPEAFVEIIQNFEGLINENSVKMQAWYEAKQKKSKEDVNPFEKAYDMFQDGVSQLRNGVSSYYSYLEDNDYQHIKSGSRDIILGASKLHRAQQTEHTEKLY